ncbi:hypothetical protein NL676_031215 [Syzygium grande]|nr:hypothetical protein NL676_031215 [Syzygium grande]
MNGTRRREGHGTRNEWGKTMFLSHRPPRAARKWRADEFRIGSGAARFERPLGGGSAFRFARGVAGAKVVKGWGVSKVRASEGPSDVYREWRRSCSGRGGGTI